MLLTGIWMTAFHFVDPHLRGWGYEHYRWAPFWVRCLLAAAGGLGALWLWNRRNAAAVLRWRPPPLRWPYALVLIFSVLFALRENRHVGDWLLSAFKTPMEPAWLFREDVFWRAPLTQLIAFVQWLPFHPFVDVAFLEVFQAISALWGTAILVLVWVLGRALFTGRRLALLFAGVYATSGMIYFSAGHVEVYPIILTFLLLAAVQAAGALRRRRGAPEAGAALGAAVMAHPQNIVYLPSYLVVLLCGRDRHLPSDRLRLCLIAPLVIPAVLIVFGLIVQVEQSVRAIGDENLIELVLPSEEVFDEARMNDLSMILLRLLPAAPALLLAMLLWRRRLPIRDTVALWFGICFVMGLTTALFIWNKRMLVDDWDLMAPSLLMITLWFLIVVTRAAPRRGRARILLCLIALQLPHTALWLAWNKTTDPEQELLKGLMIHGITSQRHGGVQLLGAHPGAGENLLPDGDAAWSMAARPPDGAAVAEIASLNTPPRREN
jgi:hypothetical protein